MSTLQTRHTAGFLFLQKEITIVLNLMEYFGGGNNLWI